MITEHFGIFAQVTEVQSQAYMPACGEAHYVVPGELVDQGSQGELPTKTRNCDILSGHRKGEEAIPLSEEALRVGEEALRVVIVDDTCLNGEQLATTFKHVPGALVVAEVTTLAMASTLCENGVADAVLVSATAIAAPAFNLDYLLDACTSKSLECIEDATPISSEKSPWETESEKLEKLSSRERDVFMLLGMGLSNRHIAQALGVTEPTVKSHVRGVLSKLSLESRLQAGLAALTHMLRDSARRPRRLRRSRPCPPDRLSGSAQPLPRHRLG
jgi:DNA-binding CsgD family transcriptional regulator